MTDGACPTLNFEKTYYNIDIKQYPGTWYQVMHYADVERSLKANCRIMTLVDISEPDSDKYKFEMVLNDKRTNGKCKNTTLIKSQVDADGNEEDGVLFGYFNGHLIAKYRMADIDLDQTNGYYLTYSCSDKTYMGQTKKAENLFVKTRT